MVREINAMAVRCDWVLPGLTEGALLTGSTTPQGIAEYYLERGVQQVAVKNGGLGAELFTADRRALPAGGVRGRHRRHGRRRRRVRRRA